MTVCAGDYADVARIVSVSPPFWCTVFRQVRAGFNLTVC
jgi:hypothetical protein